ncbi:putative signal transduction protein with CBS domains [Planococcus donghaensis MPA1U2]|uniref:Putative signal transduction protein with CBS domains n=1 Tax=Planococcus donghaensis MPA1U2 TaxID=933115 RepID=E7RJI3_9BACL|nr:CBS domain-containing protein [Planococcus donghaensis]EGA88825.1 putative signal transduction protein with CBS domains [Planococcus donghaensis MPA1U2]
MRIEEIMTTDVETCMPESTLQEVASMMREINVGAIPICEKGRLVGIVTDRDIIVRGMAEQLPSDTAIAEILSEEVITGTIDLSAEQAAELMTEHKIRRLPIVENDRIIGIISWCDLATTKDSTTLQQQDATSRSSGLEEL